MKSIVTTFKYCELKNELGDDLLVLFPIEVLEGNIIDDKFIDGSGNEYLEVTEAFKENKDYGYSRAVSLENMLEYGRRMIKSSRRQLTEEEVLALAKSGYESELDEMIFFIDLDDILMTLNVDDVSMFEEEYDVKIDLEHGLIKQCNPNSVEKEKKEEVLEKPKIKLTRVGLIEEIKKYVLSQDEVVSKVVSTVYNPIALGSSDLKQNILLYGPSGCGKSMITERLAKLLDFPYYKANVASFSASGYAGESIEDLFVNLYLAANSDLKKLERGAFLHLEEIDKLIFSEKGTDVKSQVYNELLAVLEPGSEVSFKVRQDSRPIKYNTKNLLIVCSGSFAGMENTLKKEETKIGFGSTSVSSKREYTPTEFIKYGIPVEFIGRLSKIIKLNKLTEEDLYKIITTSASSDLVIYKSLLKSKGITLEIPELALRFLTHEAIKLETGARALKGLLNDMIAPEIDHVVDMLDQGISEEIIYKPEAEELIKRLKK
ncbi:MAG: AAA family ATPase [Erysipelotrichaceae bacterium]|nr:AAA family ATPase [Erysipelotrichaceae bacterium]